MKVTLEIPDELLQRIKLRAARRKRKLKDEIDAEARARRTTRSAILRVRLKRPAARGGHAPSLWERMKDLVIHDEDAPADLASGKAHSRGYGRSRRR